MTDEATESDPLGRRLLEDAEEMRRSGYQVVDAIVDRWSRLDDGPAWQGATRDVTGPLLHGPPPEEGRDLDGLLEQVLQDVMPLAARIDHPRFLAFIPSSPSWASVLASFLITGYNVFQGTWLESAGPSQIELTVTGWFRDWLGYPEGGGGLFTSGASVANLVAIVAAREMAGNPGRATLYLSEQAHASVERAAGIAGIAPELIRVVAVDEEHRMIPSRLHQAIRRDRAEGLRPFCLTATAGTTNAGAIDPLNELGAIAREEGLWYHIDAAYGGFAVLDPRTRPLLKGLELSDSITLDPHKWLFQPYETGCLVARDVTRLESAFRIMPEYLQDAAWGPEHVNFCNRGPQLTRAFRALRVWLAVHRYGLAAHRDAIAHGIALAERVAARIRREGELELLAPQSLGMVCLRYRGRPGALRDDQLDDVNAHIQGTIVAVGLRHDLLHTLEGTVFPAACILNARTTADDVDRVLDRILELGRELAE